jgi:hypothetical protein
MPDGIILKGWLGAVVVVLTVVGDDVTVPDELDAIITTT